MSNGSLAIWCDTPARDAASLCPSLDVHFNLWLDLPATSPASLDVGFLIKDPCQINQLCLYFPASVARSDISDLGTVLKDNQTLSAIFNSTLELGYSSDRSFEAIDTKDDSRIQIGILRENDITIEVLDTGTVLRFAQAVIDNMKEAEGDHYIRFRVRLDRDLASLFLNSTSPPDSLVVSGFHSTDVVEFRVNERRNFGFALRERTMHFPIFGSINYFLIRNIETELIRSHADFRKMRRLEPGLWDRYLAQLGKVAAENCIIYQWKAINSPSDFIALAIFSKPRYHIIVYIFGILLLGAAGAALASILTLSSRAVLGGDDRLSIQLSIFSAILSVLILIYCFQHKRSIFSWSSSRLLAMKTRLSSWRK